LGRSKERADYRFVDVLGGIETLDASYSRQIFSRHIHEGYTIGVIETGAQRFFRTGGNHVAPENSIILVNAEEVHDGSSATENGWSYKALYPLPTQFSRLSEEFGCPKKGAPYFPSPVVQDKKLSDLLRLTFQTLDNSNNLLLRETLVYTTLAQLMLRHGKSRPSLTPQLNSAPQLRRVKSFLDDQPDVNISLEALAQLVELSPFHLVRQFHNQYGLPPHAYQIQTRLRQAKRLIKQGKALSEVAQDSGFNDQSHFHRHFKKAFGVTPGQYSKEIGRKNIQEG
jgi:AraC-like DNA-binding protein